MSVLRVVQTVSEMQKIADEMRNDGIRIGLVPTMGCFHQGHLSLIHQIRRVSDRTVVSIFVNPIQFSPEEDYSAYPQDLGRDVSLVEKLGAELVFAPSEEEIYPEGYSTYIEVEKLTNQLCGLSRPGHFRGVTTVVCKLFLAVKPHVAVFGQKDAQQAIVIRKMVCDMNLDVEIMLSPIVRETDGLAMSSRNTYLSPEERLEAPVLFQSLQEAQMLVEQGEQRTWVVVEAMRRRISQKSLAQIEYVAAVNNENLKPLEKLSGKVLLALAVRFGKARLIDNLVVQAG